MTRKNIITLLLGSSLALPLFAQDYNGQTILSSEIEQVLDVARASYGASPIIPLTFTEEKPSFLKASYLANYADAFYHLGHLRSIELVDHFIEEYPSDSRRAIHSLHKGSLFMKEGDFNRARHTFEQMDETALSSEERSEWLVRLAYSLLKSKRDMGNISSLFDKAANNKSYWGKVAKLYVAGELMAKKDFQKAEQLYVSLLDDETFAGEALVGLSSINYFQGNYEKAISIIQSIEKHDLTLSTPSTLLQVAGNSYYRIGNRDEAIQYLSKLRDMGKNNLLPEDWLILGTALMENGELNRSIDPLLEATQSKGVMAHIANLYLGRVRRDLGRYTESINSYEMATQKNVPEDIRESAMYEMALVMRSSGQSNFGQDVRIAEEFLTSFPKSRHIPTMERFLAEFYLSNTDYEKSLNSIRKIPNQSAPIREAKQYVLNHLALGALEEGDTEKARSFVYEALQNKENAHFRNESYIIQSELDLLEANYPTAIRTLRQLLSSKSLSKDNRAEVQFRLAYALFNNKDYLAAKHSFINYLASGKGDRSQQSNAESRLADCYYSLGDVDNAIAAYSRAIRLSPKGNNYPLLRSAEIYGLKKDYANQIVALDKIIANNSDYSVVGKAMLEKGRAYIFLNEPSEAKSIFSSAYRKFGHTENGRQAQLQLGLLYYNQSDTDSALSAYSKLMKDYPYSEEAKTAFSNLKRICIDEGRIDYIEQIEGTSNNHFSLSNDEARDLMFQSAESEFSKSSPKAERSLRYFVDKYQAGIDVLKAEKYLGDIAFKQGDSDRALRLYSKVIKQKGELPQKMINSVLARLGHLYKKQGDNKLVFQTYRELYYSSTDMTLRKKAVEEALQGAYKVRLYSEMIALSENALQTLGKGKLERINLLYAHALKGQKKIQKALPIYKKLGKKTNTEVGAESFISYVSLLSQKADQRKKAARLLDNFISKGTPYQYWLAKGFILRSDIYRMEGDPISADQFLESLKENYSRKDDDILSSIEQRLQAKH